MPFISDPAIITVAFNDANGNPLYILSAYQQSGMTTDQMMALPIWMIEGFIYDVSGNFLVSGFANGGANELVGTGYAGYTYPQIP